MHRNTTICFDCEVSFRGNEICSKCGKDLVSLNTKIRIPKKGKKKEWKKFKEWLPATYHHYKQFL